MIDFRVNSERCNRCGQCAVDCPARIIGLPDGYPAIAQEKESSCYRCQHCLAICPTGAISITGVNPDDCTRIGGNFPEPDALEILIRGRRSIRRYKDKNLEPDLLQRLLDVAWQAPTGVNSRDVLFTVIDDREKLRKLRENVMEGLARKVSDNSLPQGMEFFGNFVKLWQDKKVDILFRDAPHLIIASAPANGASPVPDCLISLTCFELFAQSIGVGTLWNGLVKWALFDILPNMRRELGIPVDHAIGYAMSFGMPAVLYARTVQHGTARVNRPG